MSKKATRRREEEMLPFLKRRTEDILRFPSFTYYSDCDSRQLFQAVYKTSTFSKRWSPRKLTADELGLLVMEPDGETGNGQGISSGPRQAIRVSDTVRRDDFHQEQQNSEDLPGDQDDLAEILDKALAAPAENSSILKHLLEQIYIMMLQEKSEAIKLNELKIKLKHRNDALKRDLSMLRNHQPELNRATQLELIR